MLLFLDTKQETKPPTFPRRRLLVSSLRDAVFCPFLFLARLRRAVLRRFHKRKSHFAVILFASLEPFLSQSPMIKTICPRGARGISNANSYAFGLVVIFAFPLAFAPPLDKLGASYGEPKQKFFHYNFIFSCPTIFLNSKKEMKKILF